jgi:predicted metal-binding membrane protein
LRRLAAFAAQIGPSPLPWLFALSAVAYLSLAARPAAGGVASLCGAFGVMDLWQVVQAAPLLWSPGQLAADWVLMVIAMMTPLTALQIAHVGRSSLPGRRAVSVAAFLGGYWTTWFLAIFILFPLGLLVPAIVGDSVDLLAVLGLALAFSASPAAQRARNRCHRMGRIPAFGATALFACARQGLANGGSCVAACWPWMLVPMMAQSYHFLLMLLVGVYLFAERIAPPAQPAWALPPAFGTLFGPVWSRAAARTVSRVVSASSRSAAGA